MDAQTINQTYDLLTLALIDTKLKRAGAFYIGPCPFCGGRDRFNLKATTEGWRWFCRGCGEDKYHGPIDYIMRRDNLDFKRALESLGGNVEPGPREQVTPQAPEITLPDPDWQARAWNRTNDAFAYLQSETGEPGRRYLAERGISKATIYTYLIGLDPNKFDTATKTTRPAITIPWFDHAPDGETITAIKYRFIDELARDPKHRYTSLGKQILFGLHAAAGQDVLILVEGEINAMSIMQASAQELLHIDALSFGSQSGSRQGVLQKVAHDYRSVIVWADDPEKAKEIRSLLDRPAAALCSPEMDGHKYDANALLQKAWLVDFLREAIH